MIVEIVKKEVVEVEEFWVIRGIKDTGTKKEVVGEHRIPAEPDTVAIALFLADHPSADFCSVEHNFKLKKE